MVFTLEALRARHGDSLLLHYGTDDEPRLVVIDGGPTGVYGDALKPRLEEVRAAYEQAGALGDDGELAPKLLMVSHIDDDHIRGLLDLTDELLSNQQRAPWIRPEVLWHNSFETLTGDEGEALSLGDDDEVRSLSTSPAVPTGLRQSAAVVASVKQGARLREDAELLGWRVNRPFPEGLVRAPEQGGEPVGLGDGLTLRVLAPRTDQIEGLRKEWREQMERLRKKQASPAQVAEYLDESPYNLSSIVCLAEHGDRRMLLTGDARGDHVLDALDAAGVTDQGRIHVDVLKLPHHGSIRNVDEDFFERITADHYVASGDGRHDNPERATLDLITATRDDDDFAIHLTYASGVGTLGREVEAFEREQRDAGRRFELHCRSGDALSLRIDLLDPVQH